jgi:hypothetical protein
MDKVTMLIAKYYGETGRVIHEAVGYVLVEFPDGQRYRILKSVDGLELVESTGRGRPRMHSTNADRQRAYRQRKAGKALRKYQSKTR